MAEVDPWLRRLVAGMQEDVALAVRQDLAARSPSLLSSEVGCGAGDVSFEIDVRPEEIVERTFRQAEKPVIVVSEGFGRRSFPDGEEEDRASWCVIVDPLDGSREISYGKRSAWVLTGVAPARPESTLADIVWAMQTEVPPLNQDTAVVLTADKGAPPTVRAWDLRTKSQTVSPGLTPSVAGSIRGGYAVFADYFAGIHELTGRMFDRVLQQVLGVVNPGEALVFNDQYLSTAGCMYLLASGRYRFFADLRPLVWRAATGGTGAGLCAHPYDLCTALIAEQAGVIVTDPGGKPLRYPLSTDHDCAWVGYANEAVRSEVEPALQQAIRELTELGDRRSRQP